MGFLTAAAFVLTSNLPLTQWASAFAEDQILASAMLGHLRPSRPVYWAFTVQGGSELMVGKEPACRRPFLSLTKG